MNLALLRRGLPLFMKVVLPSLLCHFFFPRGLGTGSQPSGSSDITSAQVPHASLSLQYLESPLYFTREDQRPSLAVYGLIFISGSEEEVVSDDFMSLTASDAEE